MEPGQPIQSLSPREHIRLRPGMYLGGTGYPALHQLIYECVEPVVRQAQRGLCDRIDVTLLNNSTVRIADNGPGLPVEIDEKLGRRRAEVIFSDFDENSIKLTEELFGSSFLALGMAPVNAVCSHFAVEIKRDGFLWQQSYQEGLPLDELKPIRALAANEPSGTSITLTPDFSVLKPADFDLASLSRRFIELAAMAPGLTINLDDQRSEPQALSRLTLHFPKGLADYVRHLNHDYEAIHEPIVIQETMELTQDRSPMGISAEISIAFQYCDAPQPLILSFVNMFEVRGGGKHVEGFIRGLEGAINDAARNLKLSDRRLSFHEYELLNSLTVVISITHPNPHFAGSTKYELINPELYNAVLHLTRESLGTLVNSQPETMRAIVLSCQAIRQRTEQRRSGSD